MRDIYIKYKRAIKTISKYHVLQCARGLFLRNHSIYIVWWVPIATVAIDCVRMYL